ncbi:MAG: L,D-transpeptidase [Gammaproteobacteria bacterium]
MDQGIGILRIGFLCLWLMPGTVLAFQPWLLVDTKAEKVIVFGAEGPLDVFDNIALGVRGAGLKQRRGDELTPLGSFQVGWFNRASRFDLFIGLNYPNLEYATLAYYDGRINESTYQRIKRALARGERPPQDTLLGGYIGLHGTGAGDPEVHENFNWTNGCIALTNEQIHRLARWVKPGTRVEVR